MKSILFPISLLCAISCNAQSLKTNMPYSNDEAETELILDALKSIYEDPINKDDVASYVRDNQNGIDVIHVRLSDQLPEVIYKSVSIILSQGGAYVFNLDYVYVFTYPNNEKVFVGGTFIFRGRGNYHIYVLEGDSVRQVFRSSILFYNSTTDCKTYSEDKLLVQKIDINGDGYSDLQLTGVENDYCTGEQDTRLSDKIIDRRAIKIDLVFVPEKNKFEENIH